MYNTSYMHCPTTTHTSPILSTSYTDRDHGGQHPPALRPDAAASALRRRLAAIQPVGNARFLASTEDRLPDTDNGRTFLDREFVVAGHAHRQLVHRGAVRCILAQPIAQFAQAREARAHFCRVVGEQRERHQAAYTQR